MAAALAAYPSTTLVLLGLEGLGAAATQDGASSSTERATRIRRPQAHEQARALRERPGPAGLVCSVPQHQRRSELGQRLGVAGGGRLGDAGRRPADRLHVDDLQAELAGEGGVAMLLWRSSWVML